MTSHYDRETLIDYLHGALAPEADAAVFTHLEHCAPCRAAHDEEAALGEMLRVAARAQERELPSLVKARVWDAVRNERPSWSGRLLNGWLPRIALPVAAAAAVLAAVFGAPILHAPHAPLATISAMLYLDEHAAEAQSPLGPGVAPAIYSPEQTPSSPSTAATYIDTADAATLGDADGATQ